jgi:23S rRNA (uridine2552-2'-O)-methyltransferase
VKRTNSSARWLNEHFNDHYVKQAQKAGYRSRAAFKLLEILKKDRLLRSGMVVVDLGAAPGGWSVIAKQAVGETGRVFALDILPMEPLAGVDFVQGDFNDDEVMETMLQQVGEQGVDLVMSDLAPNMSGISAVDQARSFQLVEQALLFARQVLKPNGNFVVKVFQGEGFESFLKELRASFTRVNIRKPQASRGRSPEIYFVAIGLKS